MKVNNIIHTYICTNNEGNNKQNLRNKQLKASPLSGDYNQNTRDTSPSENKLKSYSPPAIDDGLFRNTVQSRCRNTKKPTRPTKRLPF